MNNEETQNKQIKAHLDNGKTISPMEALKKYNCWRLASRIKDLRYTGMNISTEMVKDTFTGKRYAKYMKVV